MSTNAAIAANLSDILMDLGNIPARRVRSDPKPGSATVDDLLRVNSQGGMCELIDGVLVEKAMGWRESLIASLLCELIRQFLRAHDLGLVSGPDGFFKILKTQVRGPDVAFTSWDRLPGGKVPHAPVPELVPDLAIEILSEGNTYGEMARKRREYFHAGVRQVWMIDLDERTVAVYSDITQYELFDETQSLSGGDILPGLQISLSELFGELDRTRPT
jgi:Uma2 family endonuclease